jgi:SIR2-like domain
MGGHQSWGNLLTTLSAEANLPAHEPIGEKPFTLVFEAIHTCKLREQSDFREFQLKEKAAKTVEVLRPNDYHKKLAELPVQHILTTNYDYCLEEAVNDGKPPSERISTKPERKFSLYRRYRLHKRTFWHIHGERMVPNTIMLGHDHYAGYLKAVRDSLLIPSLELDKAEIGRRATRRGETVRRCERWVDIFLLADLDIVGFGFDFTESVLWWLLHFRVKSKYRSKLPVGDIRFHAFRGPKQDDVSGKEKARNQLLTSFGVRVEDYPPQDYSRSYDQFVKQFRQRKPANN